MAAGDARDGLIRTPDQRLRVFISSTLAELADERAAVARAISALRLTPVLFELGARPHPPQELYRAYLAQSDVFVGLYWQRYGWVGPDMDISGLEDEFQLSSSIPRLLYVKTPAPEREARLAAMIEQLQSEGTDSYRPFSTPEELDRLVRDDLAVLLSERFLTQLDAAAPHDVDAPLLRSLPVPSTSLIGRDQDVNEVAKLLVTPGNRLVTLTGPGGIGKTRLALAVGEQLQERFPHATAFVSLASITRPELVMPRVVDALGASVEGSRAALDVLADHISSTPTLLILDNLEQVVGVAPELDELLARCPGVVILATSRTGLRLRAEREFPVGPLAVLEAADNHSTEHIASLPAVQLFIDRAQAVRYDFALTGDNAEAVAEICRRLDGLPLAIELAAARVRLLEPNALLARLERGLDALGTGPVDLPERQRTLRATVEWSIDLLDDAEKDMLATFAVFVDGWTVDAATVVGGAGDDTTLDLLDALVGHSLVKVDATSGGLRFRMLESVREIAAERLEQRTDAPTIEQRHADYFSELVLSSDWTAQPQEDWAGQLRVEEGNIRRAIRWHFAHDIQPLPHLFRVLWLEWQMRDRMPEGRAWVDELLARSDELDGPSRVQLLLTAGVTAGEVGDYAEAMDLARRLEAERIDDPYLQSAAHLAYAWVGTMNDDFDGALVASLRALDGFRAQEAEGVLGFAPFISGSALLTVGMIETTVGRYDDARAHFDEMRKQGDAFGNAFLASGARAQLAWLAVIAGDLEEARKLLRDAVDVRDDDELGTHPLSFSLVSYAKLLLADGDAQRAALALGAAEGVRRRAGLQAWASTQQTEFDLVADARAALSETELGGTGFDVAFTAGSDLNRADAIALIREGL